MTAQGLQARRQEGRREHHDGDFKRMGKSPAPAVGNNRELGDSLDVPAPSRLPWQLSVLCRGRILSLRVVSRYHPESEMRGVRRSLFRRCRVGRSSEFSRAGRAWIPRDDFLQVSSVWTAWSEAHLPQRDVARSGLRHSLRPGRWPAAGTCDLSVRPECSSN